MVVKIETEFSGCGMYPFLFQISVEHFLILHSGLLCGSWNLHFLNNLSSSLEDAIRIVR